MTELLFQPLTVMGMEFKNRILHEPTTMNMSDPNGHVTDRIVGVYESLARGGYSAVTVGATCVRRDGLINERMLGIYDDTYVIGLRDLVEVIHNNDTLAGIQLFYGGLIPGLAATTPLPPGEGWIPGTLSWGASDRAIIGNPKPGVISTEGYEELVEAYGQGARRAREAGFDFVGFHFCHGSLPHTNLSLLSNVGRTDKYADRFLFVEEIIQRTQQLCGRDFPIMPRICCDENLQGGFDIEYFAENYAPRLHRLGVAVIDCTFGSMIRAQSRRADIGSGEFIGGGFYTPNGVNIGNIQKTKALLRARGIDTPLIGSCNLGTPAQVRQMVEEGGAEFAGVCRFSLDDPAFPRKMLEGREREIRKSTRTGASLLHGNIFGKGYAGSPQNPEFGHEREYRIVPTRSPKKVVIVGGGSGGMEYASVAKQVGHNVVVFEKSGRLGGVMDWCGNYPHLPNVESIRYQPEYHTAQMEILGVDCRLNTEATPELILAEKPDVVVIATGARAKLPAVPGLEEGRRSGFVLTIDEVMARENAADPGEAPVVWGVAEGIELALEFARQGRKVRLIDSNPTLSLAPYLLSRAGHVLRWLAEAGVAIETGVAVHTIRPGCLAVRRASDPRSAEALSATTGQEVTAGMTDALEEIACDHLVLCLGREPVNELKRLLAGKVPEIHVLGDAKAPRSYGNAIHEAAYLARQVP
ncbi:MAG: FAD-dependent oxidoreductase [Chloroflexi bacterium]|nr:FAD-dependent oxidoreductase [Chloroflexota bacterium]